MGRSYHNGPEGSEEKSLLDSVEKGEWKSVQGVKRRVKTYREYANATFRKDKRVNIRMSRKDLTDIQKKAMGVISM